MSAVQWILIAIVSGAIEVASAGFWFLWLGVSALLVALGVSLGFFNNLESQLLMFALFSALFIIFTRPLVVKLFKSEDIPTNTEALIGQHGVSLNEIKPLHYGQVKLNGEIWTAASDEEITEGSRVEVIGIEGVKLLVKNAR
ncbi:MAG: NfeD family protein [Syntrophomonadaceae bacterium]|jgi:membrane protein implicated in regulation of membrane protease activity|nr:NfeD family protein [Syntrophomonadaceae bacterium]